MSKREYKVQERSDEGDWWYDHPSTVYADERVAYRRLRMMEETYTKYGRVFRMVYREVSEWKEHTPR